MLLTFNLKEIEELRNFFFQWLLQIPLLKNILTNIFFCCKKIIVLFFFLFLSTCTMSFPCKARRGSSSTCANFLVECQYLLFQRFSWYSPPPFFLIPIPIPIPFPHPPFFEVLILPYPPIRIPLIITRRIKQDPLSFLYHIQDLITGIKTLVEVHIGKNTYRMLNHRMFFPSTIIQQ